MEREGKHIAINLGKRQMWFPILIENVFAAYTPWLRESWFSFTADKGKEEWRPLCLNFIWPASTSIGQTPISALDFAFSFYLCDFPWKWAKRNCVASWEECHGYPDDFPWAHVTQSLCYSWCCRWRESGLSCLLISCVQTIEGKQQKKRSLFQDTGQSSSFGEELMPTCDYLGYCIYGKVTYEAILDTS